MTTTRNIKQQVRELDLVGWIEATKPNILKPSLPSVIMKRHITGPIQSLGQYILAN